MITPEWRFTISCDKCGKYLQKDDIIITELLMESMIDNAEQVGWRRKNGQWLCPNCQNISTKGGI